MRSVQFSQLGARNAVENSAILRISMKDLREVRTQLERALGTLMDAAEQQPDANLAEAVDHVSTALARLRASEDNEDADASAERAETGVAPQTARFERKIE